MAIMPDDPCLNERVILKLYDRRFATGLREDQKIQPWTFEIEQEYQQTILDGRVSEFIKSLHSEDDEDEKEEEEPWNAAQDEAYLFDYMQRLYEAEYEVYQRLEDIQGRDIPRFLGRVKMPGNDSQSTTVSEYVDCPGILLQYIEGVPLSDLASFAPKEAWQEICEDAIRIVNLLGDRGILNEDVKPWNFIVRKESDINFKVFMIDFALCNFREEYEDEEDWLESKAMEDEEGAVGCVMESRLEGGFVYHRSARSVELAERLMSLLL